jgi:cytochrome c oxidase assembly protein subunit 15
MSKLRTLLRAAVANAPSFSAVSSVVRTEAEIAGNLLRAMATQQVPRMATGLASRSPASLSARWMHTFSSGSVPSVKEHGSYSFIAALLSRQARHLALQHRGLSTVAAVGGTTSSFSATAALTAGLSPGTRRALTIWLAGGSAWVFSMVVIGGITRLTRSGLSMTDWKFTGEKPPQTQEEWQAEFERYKLSPEFKLVNSTMDLEHFKFIYWMEWGHRMWGRALGIFFAVPCAIFAARGAITRPLARRLGILFLMGGSQGLVGWWMVRSGLIEPTDNKVPRVSSYRLAAHLTSAFAIYATMVWTTLSVAFPNPLVVTAGPPAARAAAALYKVALPAAVLLGTTAISGAFVAGIDAGHAYNTFPDMNGQWIPEEYFDMTGWRNIFENTAAVQLHHRLLALTTLCTSLALWRYGTRMLDLPRASRLLLHSLAAGVACQVSLGVATLLTYVPVSLGSAHQAGAMTLFTIMLSLLYTVRPAPTLAPFRMLASMPLSTTSAAVAVMAVGGAVANSA